MLELKNLSKKFGDNLLFENLEYSFEKGKSYYITGKSGVGKTTILNIIYGYEKVDSGIVEYNNLVMEYMFQETLLFENLSIRDNFNIKCAALKKSTNNEYEYKKLLDRIGLSSQLDDKVNTLSGGEKQRLYLAQLSFSNPDVVLLDEPACKLDCENKRNIYILADEMFENSIRIIVSHDDEIKDMNGQMLELREGKLWEI